MTTLTPRPDALKAADALFEQASHVHLGGLLPMTNIHIAAQNLGPLLTRYQQSRAALAAAPQRETPARSAGDALRDGRCQI